MIASKHYFNNKTAIVTGSSGGIGKETAIQLLKLGANVVINGRYADKLDLLNKELSNYQNQVLMYPGDISDPEIAQGLVRETIKKFNKIDILINNAGVSMRGNLGELNPEVVRSVFETNVFGAVYLTTAALEHIRKVSGHIIFISSVVGIRGLPGLSIYSASKMSLKAIAESLRIEETSANIHVGLIQVGFTEIEHNKKVIAADGSLITLSDRSKYKAQTKKYVADAILKNILKRKFITTLSAIGKLNSFLQSLFPSLVEWILISSTEKIKEKSR